jgi:electron transport complex protein RnfG
MLKKMFENKDSIATLTLSLLIITICAGLILGVVYGITKEPIAWQEALKETAARQTVLPGADTFEEIDITGLNVTDDYQIVEKVFEGAAGGRTAGYTMAIVTKGYSPGLSLTVGIGTDGVVTGVEIGSHEETPGLGANAASPDFLAQYEGADGPFVVVKTLTGAESEVQALTGATITSNAVTDAVSLARDFYQTYLTGEG